VFPVILKRSPSNLISLGLPLLLFICKVCSLNAMIPCNTYGLAISPELEKNFPQVQLLLFFFFYLALQQGFRRPPLKSFKVTPSEDILVFFSPQFLLIAFSYSVLYGQSGSPPSPLFDEGVVKEMLLGEGFFFPSSSPISQQHTSCVTKVPLLVSGSFSSVLFPCGYITL